MGLEFSFLKLFNATIRLDSRDLYFRPFAGYLGMVKPTSAIAQGFFDMSSFATSRITIGTVFVTYLLEVPVIDVDVFGKIYNYLKLPESQGGPIYPEDPSVNQFDTFLSILFQVLSNIYPTKNDIFSAGGKIYDDVLMFTDYDIDPRRQWTGTQYYYEWSLSGTTYMYTWCALVS